MSVFPLDLLDVRTFANIPIFNIGRRIRDSVPLCHLMDRKHHPDHHLVRPRRIRWHAQQYLRPVRKGVLVMLDWTRADADTWYYPGYLAACIFGDFVCDFAVAVERCVIYDLGIRMSTE